MSPLVVLFSGKQGSGKTTTATLVARNLGKRDIQVHHYRFAQPIYEMHDAIYAVGQKYGIELQGTKDGELLQFLGTEWGRQKKGKDVWVNAALARINRHSVADVFVIDDLRFENEFDAFPNGLRIRLDAPESERKVRASYWRENTQHPSEIGLDAYAEQGKFDAYFDTINQGAVTIAAAVYDLVWDLRDKGVRLRGSE